MKKLLFISFCCLVFGCAEFDAFFSPTVAPQDETIFKIIDESTVNRATVNDAITKIDDQLNSVINSPKAIEKCKSPKLNNDEVVGCDTLKIYTNYTNSIILEEIAYWRETGESPLVKHITLNDDEFIIFMLHYIELSRKELQSNQCLVGQVCKRLLTNLRDALEKVDKYYQDTAKDTAKNKKDKYPNISEEWYYNRLLSRDEQRLMLLRFIGEIREQINIIEEQELEEEKAKDAQRLKVKMAKIQKKYGLKYKLNGYCEQELGWYLYNNSSFRNINCILQHSSSFINVRVIQVLPNGILVMAVDNFPSGKMAFIKTNKKYVDDDYIDRGVFYYGGTYQYQTVAGSTQTIDKLVEIND
jgi:hypothetical protein